MYQASEIMEKAAYKIDHSYLNLIQQILVTKD